MRLIGIGDLHFESPLKRLLPDYNSIVLNSVEKAIRQGAKKGAEGVIFYGDISHYPGKDSLSDDVMTGLISLFKKFPDMTFFILEGNHDRRSGEDSSLTLLKDMSAGGRCDVLQNVAVFTEPKYFKKYGINFLPFPNTDTQPYALNVLHVDCKGSKMDSGREVTEGFTTKHLCVSGHLHTAQKVRNIHFSGTLHQTTFGEDPDKFYHLIDWDGDVGSARIQLVPFQAEYRLTNTVLNTEKEYEAFLVKYRSEDRQEFPIIYHKVFVCRQLILPTDPFGKMPRVLKSNAFSTAKELSSAMTEELTLELGDSGDQSLHVSTVFTEWMSTNDIPPDLQRRATEKLHGLLK